MPRLWTDSIDAHRRVVRDTTLDTAAALAGKHGVRSVTMSQIAEHAGVGRATLYKYFSSVDAILVAWHERQIARHLDHLARVRDETAEPEERLHAVLDAYALIAYEHHGSTLAAALHQGEHVARAEKQLKRFLRVLVAEAADRRVVRSDVPAEELAAYCLHAVEAAASVPSKAAARRLVTVITAGLRTPR